MQRNLINVGDKFGKLTVTGDHLERKDKRFYNCTCECGKTTIATSSALKTGHKVSCGCAQRESIQKTMVKHGMSRASGPTSEYNCYMAMVQRCHNSNNPQYKHYGARGIVVDESWRGENGFKQFIADIGNKPGKSYSIERIDNDGPYSKDNCKWADLFTQARNKRSTVLLTKDGRTMCLADWARQIGICPTSMAKRIHKWGVEKALSTPAPSQAVPGAGVEPTPETSNQS